MKENFSKYGVNFRKIESLQDIEKLRVFRNLSHVRTQMFFQNEISQSSHIDWFNSLNKSKNIYFIYSDQWADIGIVNIKDINLLLGTGEAGIFVGNEKYLNSHLNIGALLFLYNYAFYTVRLDRLHAHILPTNNKAIRMNMSLGFKLINSDENLYMLDKSSYLLSKQKFEPLFNC